MACTGGDCECFDGAGSFNAVDCIRKGERAFMGRHLTLQKYPMTLLNVVDLLLVLFCVITLIFVFASPCGEGTRRAY